MTEYEKASLSEAIRIQRFINKKTQKDCADMLGISIVTYREYEKNPEKLDISQALKLSVFLNWNLFQFFLNDILQNAISE